MTGHRQWNAYILRFGSYAVFHEPDEPSSVVLQHFREGPFHAFQTERERWQMALAPARQYRRLASHPARFLFALEQAWPTPSG